MGIVSDPGGRGKGLPGARRRGARGAPRAGTGEIRGGGRGMVRPESGHEPHDTPNVTNVARSPIGSILLRGILHYQT